MRLSITRRAFLGGTASAAVVPTSHAQTANWPERTIQLTHGFGVGGNADVISRITGEQLTQRLGQAVVVEARPGAGGRIAAAYAAKASPDGHTLVVLPGGHAIAPAMFDGLPYDTVNDFTYVSMLTEFPFILVTYPEHPVTNVAELIAAAKAAPEPIIYGSAGNGTGQHLSGALFAQMAGVRMQHLPFRGGAVGSTELLGKHIHFLYETPTLLLELIRSGALRAIAVTGSQRFFALPDVPTIGETVRGYETTSWLGLAGPRNLPDQIGARLNKEVHGFLADTTIVERLRTLGNVPVPTSPVAFKERVAADVAKWTRVGADVGLARTKLAQ